MTLHTLTIPDDPADLPRWLEQRVVGLDFGQFVAELSAHVPPAPGAVPPRQLLDRWIPVALERGFDPLPADLLRLLLRNPVTLVAIQERILRDGGAYWDDVLDGSNVTTEAFDRGRESLDRIFARDTPSNENAVPVAGRLAVPSEVARRTGGRAARAWAIISTGVAACLALALGYQTAQVPDKPPVLKAQIAWGWGKPGGLAPDQSAPKEYLTQLAANAEEWSMDRPSEALGVATRIAEFRTGCSRLMHSTYGSLTPADKAWLLEQCRGWAKALDAHQQALDAGADPLTVRTGVDETVRRMATTLRDKAKQIS